MKFLFYSVLVILIFGKASAAEPDASFEHRRAYSAAYNGYFNAMLRGERAKARKFAKLAYQHGEIFFGPESKNTAKLMFIYGRLIDNPKIAVPFLIETVKSYKKIFGADSGEILGPILALAKRNDDLGKAKQLYSQALEIGERHYLDRQLELDVESLLKARKIFEDGNDTNIGHLLAQVDYLIGKQYVKQSEFKKAATSLSASLNHYIESEPSGQKTLSNRALLIEAYENLGERDKATVQCLAIGAARPEQSNQRYMPIYSVTPVYPGKAMARADEGYAVVSLTVDSNGFVSDPKVIDYSGSRYFKRAARNAVKKFRYVPKFKNGKPVETKDVRYKFTFRLAN